MMEASAALHVDAAAADSGSDEDDAELEAQLQQYGPSELMCVLCCHTVRADLLLLLCCRVALGLATQRLFDATDADQLHRRLSRFCELEEDGDSGRLSPRSRGLQVHALAGLRHMLQETGVISDEEEDEGTASDEEGEGEADDASSVATSDNGLPFGAGSDDDDDVDEADLAGLRLPGVHAMTGATTPDDYGPPPPFRTEHCPPLPDGVGPQPHDHCACADGACICDTLAAAWLEEERELAEQEADEDREPNDRQRYRCYRRAAIRLLHCEFRQPLPPCLVVAIRRCWPADTGIYMGYRSR
eukprot:SAG22_NODE_979_length_6186_cov_10.777887_2_plen_301_part_00